jgi:hypothetical protein
MLERPDMEELREVADFLFQQFVGFKKPAH